MRVDEEKIWSILSAAAEGLISVPELLGFTEDDAERLYRAALAFFERGATVQAESVLEWLVSAKPYVARYWTAYGASLQAREAFLAAIRAYTTALAIAPDDLVARTHRGECCLMVGLVERGVADLSDASRRGDVPSSLEPWVARAKGLLTLHEAAAALE